jgi:hypothetical protein
MANPAAYISSFESPAFLRTISVSRRGGRIGSATGTTLFRSVRRSLSSKVSRGAICGSDLSLIHSQSIAISALLSFDPSDLDPYCCSGNLIAHRKAVAESGLMDDPTGQNGRSCDLNTRSNLRPKSRGNEAACACCWNSTGFQKIKCFFAIEVEPRPPVSRRAWAWAWAWICRFFTERCCKFYRANKLPSRVLQRAHISVYCLDERNAIQCER